MKAKTNQAFYNTTASTRKSRLVETILLAFIVLIVYLNCTLQNVSVAPGIILNPDQQSQTIPGHSSGIKWKQVLFTADT